MILRTNSLVAVCALPSLVWYCNVSALDAALDVDQYAHTTWKDNDGPVRGPVITIAQTPDGYLWFGTETGLIRFDGFTAVPWHPPSGTLLPDEHIRALLAAQDGSLWIGTWAGLAHWSHAKLDVFPQLAGQFINALLQDRQGTVWVAATIQNEGVHATICSIRDGDIDCQVSDRHEAIGSLYEDSNGRLWASGSSTIWRVRPGTYEPRTVSRKPIGSLHALAEDADGTLL